MGLFPFFLLLGVHSGSLGVRLGLACRSASLGASAFREIWGFVLAPLLGFPGILPLLGASGLRFALLGLSWRPLGSPRLSDEPLGPNKHPGHPVFLRGLVPSGLRPGASGGVAPSGAGCCAVLGGNTYLR